MKINKKQNQSANQIQFINAICDLVNFFDSPHRFKISEFNLITKTKNVDTSQNYWIA